MGLEASTNNSVCNIVLVVLYREVAPFKEVHVHGILPLEAGTKLILVATCANIIYCKEMATLHNGLKIRGRPLSLLQHWTYCISNTR